MVDQAHAAASGVPLEIGERKFIAAPLTDRQWGEMTRWLQSRYYRIAKEAIDPEATELEREREEQHALTLVSRLDARTSMREIAIVPDGFAFWTWQLVRRDQPNITLDEVSALLQKTDDADNVYAAWKLLMHAEDDEKSPPQAATQG